MGKFVGEQFLNAALKVPASDIDELYVGREQVQLELANCFQTIAIRVLT